MAPRADGLMLVRPPAVEDAPQLSAGEARALFKLARMDPLQKLQKLDRATLREVQGIPPRFWEKYASPVMVTIYPPGGEPLVGVVTGGNLVVSTVGAAHAALGQAEPALLNTASLEIDLPCALTICEPEARLIPGVEGLATMREKNLAITLIPPALFLGDEPTMDDYLKRLVKLAGLPEGSEKKGLRLAKFRTVSILEPAPGAEPVFLYRGNALVEPPSKEACLQAARYGEDWLARALGEDGAVPAAYFPYAGCFDAESKTTVIEQAMTAIALTRPWREAALDDNALAATDKALAALVKQAAVNPNFKFAYFPEEKGEGYVGSTAVGLLALCERERAAAAPDAARSALMQQLAGFLLAQQTAEGEFLSHFDPVKGRPEKKFAEVHFPGQAILALVRLYDLDGRKDERLIAAARKAARHLLAAKPPADPWLMQALAALVELGDEAEFSAPLLDMTKATIAAQLKPGENVQPDQVGAIDENDPPTVAGTAARGEALLAALGALRKQRVEEALPLRAALRSAATFIIQQQYRPENSYALEKPERAAGGFRLSPLAGEVRPDAVAHAAIFLREYAALIPAAEPRR